MAIEKFTINISNSLLADLSRRLDANDGQTSLKTLAGSWAQVSAI